MYRALLLIWVCVGLPGGEEIVSVPSMGDSITEGTIVEWTKQPGETVEVDEVVVVLETDKVRKQGGLERGCSTPAVSLTRVKPMELIEVKRFNAESRWISDCVVPDMCYYLGVREICRQLANSRKRSTKKEEIAATVFGNATRGSPTAVPRRGCALLNLLSALYASLETARKSVALKLTNHLPHASYTCRGYKVPGTSSST